MSVTVYLLICSDENMLLITIANMLKSYTDEQIIEMLVIRDAMT